MISIHTPAARPSRAGKKKPAGSDGGGATQGGKGREEGGERRRGEERERESERTKKEREGAQGRKRRRGGFTRRGIASVVLVIDDVMDLLQFAVVGSFDQASFELRINEKKCNVAFCGATAMY